MHLNKEKNEELEINEGSFNWIHNITPSYVDTKNPKYIEIDGMFYAGLMAINYSRIQKGLILAELIELNENIVISMFYEKQDAYKVIKDLTYHITNNKSQIKEKKTATNQIDIAVSAVEDAAYIRKKMQLEKEDMFYLYLYVMAYARNKEELESIIRNLETIMLTKGIYTKRTYFRQDALYNSILPINYNHDILGKVSKRNILSSSLVATYPFICTGISDNNGVYIGENKINNSLVMLNRFNVEEYKNANMCILGTSRFG